MSLGQVDYVLLSRTPRLPQQEGVRLAWLNLNPIAVGSSRINWSRLSGVGYAFTVRIPTPDFSTVCTKEVIRLQVPLQPPCYDFSPLA